MSGATAATSEAVAKITSPMRKAWRCPIRSPSLPATSSSAANVMLYEVNTHASIGSGASNDARIPGRATLTIVTSIATSSIDTDVMARICQARRSTATSVAAVATGTACGSVVKPPTVPLDECEAMIERTSVRRVSAS